MTKYSPLNLWNFQTHLNQLDKHISHFYLIKHLSCINVMKSTNVSLMKPEK